MVDSVWTIDDQAELHHIVGGKWPCIWPERRSPKTVLDGITDSSLIPCLVLSASAYKTQRVCRQESPSKLSFVGCFMWPGSFFWIRTAGRSQLPCASQIYDGLTL